MKEISIKAVIIGLLVDIGGTFAFSFVFGILAALLLLATERDIKELETISETPGFLVPSLFVGLLFTSLGGYVAGRIAKQAEIKNAFALGMTSATLGVMFMIFLPDAKPIWLDFAGLSLIIPFALIGGYVCMRTKEKDLQR
ncbi:MAG: hypothetical protein HY755_04410 [Nitrospirae bacterium]|nr:hypothetical protein [Nitrospirota bacterium]